MTVITPVRCDRQLYTCPLDLLVACGDSSNIPDLKDNALRLGRMTRCTDTISVTSACAISVFCDCVLATRFAMSVFCVGRLDSESAHRGVGIRGIECCRPRPGSDRIVSPLQSLTAAPRDSRSPHRGRPRCPARSRRGAPSWSAVQRVDTGHRGPRETCRSHLLARAPGAVLDVSVVEQATINEPGSSFLPFSRERIRAICGDLIPAGIDRPAVSQNNSERPSHWHSLE
jgi:hypothetical protein